MRADMRIATLIHGSVGDPDARATAILEAIADREQVAAAVLEAITQENQALQSSMTESAVPAGNSSDPSEQLMRRDRKIEALVNHVETQSWEFNRIALRLETALQHPNNGLGRIRL